MDAGLLLAGAQLLHTVQMELVGQALLIVVILITDMV